MITHATRLRAQPITLIHELTDILRDGAEAGAPAELGWLLLPDSFQLTGFVQTVPPKSELAIREIWSAWVTIVGARRLSEVEIDGHIHLKAVAEARNGKLRITIEAELPAPQSAARGPV